jgi:hypothetical protein
MFAAVSEIENNGTGSLTVAVRNEAPRYRAATVRESVLLIFPRLHQIWWTQAHGHFLAVAVRFQVQLPVKFTVARSEEDLPAESVTVRRNV